MEMVIDLAITPNVRVGLTLNGRVVLWARSGGQPGFVALRMAEARTLAHALRTKTPVDIIQGGAQRVSFDGITLLAGEIGNEGTAVPGSVASLTAEAILSCVKDGDAIRKEDETQ